jgi:membrane protein
VAKELVILMTTPSTRFPAYFKTMITRTIWYLTKQTFKEWQEDKALRLGAALSYYTIFSLAPLLIIVIGIVSIFLGNDSAHTRILAQIQGLIGEQGAKAIEEILTYKERETSHGIMATLIGLFTLLLGATGVVGELQDALNTIWEAPEKKGGIKSILRQRVLSLAMILGIGFLLLVSLVVSAALTAFADFWGTAKILEVLNFIVSIGVITILFAAIFKFLPDIKIAWATVWIGAFVTAVLFTIGKTLTGLYLSKSAVASSFGAAGSLVIILVWVYYNSQILFFGAEFTQVYSKYRSKILQSKKKRDEEISEEDLVPMEANEMEHRDDVNSEIEDGKKSPLYKVAYKAGYQSAKVEELEEDVEHKWKLAKWAYRVVDFLGFRRSAKLGIKGYKAKKKIDEFKQKISSHDDESVQSRQPRDHR